MKRSATIRIPGPGEDRLNRSRIALSALAGSGLGLLVLLAVAPGIPDGSRGAKTETVVGLSAGDGGASDRGEIVTDGSVEPYPERVATADRTPDRQSNGAEPESPAPLPGVRPQTGTLPDSPPQQDGADSPEKREAAVRYRRVVPGRTAYLRCEGVRLVPGPFPCPRDREMEQNVWDVLRSLAECTCADCGSGHVDVRLDYKRGEEPIARVIRPARFESAVDTEAVYGYVGEALTSIPTKLDPAYMVVSFRFEIQPLP